MTNIKQSVNLDKVLDDYARASEGFDAEVLKSFIEKYPEHARALQRYAQVQLLSVPATSEEIESEPLYEEEMLPRQSKLLQRMQELRANPQSPEALEAGRKLASISGEKALREATVAVFGSCEHGEDLLLQSLLEVTSGIRGVPDWFFERLAAFIHTTSAALRDSFASRYQLALGHQRFSAKEKPTESPPMTWEQAIDECITDEDLKKEILKRSE